MQCWVDGGGSTPSKLVRFISSYARQIGVSQVAVNDYLSITPRRLERLSTLSGIAVERLRQISDGDKATAVEIAKLSRALGVSTADLLRPEPTPQQSEFRFRVAATKSQSANKVNHRTISELAAKIEGINEVLQARRKPSQKFKISGEVRRDPFALASWFRESCFDGDQVSPILRLPILLDECMGVVAIVLRRSDVDGVCAVVDGTAFIFVRSQFRPRMLFTLAHELGHLLAHTTDDDFASIDPLGSVERRPQVQLEERFANTFASELLLPRAGVGVALQAIRAAHGIGDGPVGDIELLLLSHIFGVSFEAAALRCERLALLPSGGAKALLDHVRKSFGSPEARAAEAGLPERPDLPFPPVPAGVLRSAVAAISNGEVSIGRVLDQLKVDVDQLSRYHREPADESYH